MQKATGVITHTSFKRFVLKYCKLRNFTRASLNKVQSKCSKCFIYACTIHSFECSILLMRFVLQKTRLNNPEDLNQSYLRTILQVLWLQEQYWCIVFWVRWELAPCYWKIKCQFHEFLSICGLICLKHMRMVVTLINHNRWFNKINVLPNSEVPAETITLIRWWPWGSVQRLLRFQSPTCHLNKLGYSDNCKEGLPWIFSRQWTIFHQSF